MMRINKNFCDLSVCCCFFLIIGFGCAPVKSGNKDLSFEKWKAVSEASKGHVPSVASESQPSSESRFSEPEPASSEREDRKLLPIDKIALNMQDVEVSVMLKTLAKAAGVNMIINQNVKGKATIHVVQSPWNEVFLGILQSHHLSYVWQGDILRIITPEDLSEELKASETDLKKKLQKQKEKQSEPMMTEVIKINFADPEELKKSFEQLLKGDEGDKQKSSVAVDTHTRSLLVRARPDDIDMLREMVRKVDIPAPQVLIEAHIVEATRETAWELGIQWGGLHKISGKNINTWITPNAANSIVSTQTSGTTGSEPVSTSLSPSPGMGVNLPLTGTSTGVSEGLNLGVVMQNLGGSILAFQLSSLQQDGQLRILSSPSITTLDNQAASIESGKEVPFQTVENGEVSVEFKKAVLSLKVTPHVIDNKTLKLAILTHKDELDFSNSVAGNPTIVTKNAETNVVLFDGETTVIGGLSKESLSDSEAGIPILKDIPLLGYLFKRKGSSNDLEEILIFITPHILKPK